MTILILTPTRLEFATVQPMLASGESSAGCRVELCGFGPIVAAARTALLVEKTRPRKVILVGIAGALRAELVVGQAYAFDEVVCYGVGAGTGSHFVSAGAMGWSQWDGSADAVVDDPSLPRPMIGDTIRLTSDRGAVRTDGQPSAGQLLTCCAASAGRDDVEQRLRDYPAAVAEDMEGFGVAAACRLSDTPLRIVRGISNQAGDRDTANWQIEAALLSALEIVQNLIQD